MISYDIAWAIDCPQNGTRGCLVKSTNSDVKIGMNERFGRLVLPLLRQQGPIPKPTTQRQLDFTHMGNLTTPRRMDETLY